MKTLLITDLDNTLYNWVDYFAPSFRGMAKVLSREMGVPIDVLLEDFKKVFAYRGSLEYSFAVQELDICKKFRSEEVKNFVDIAKTVFSMIRQKNLKPYDDVENTLKWATNSGVLIVGVTNAPVFHAEMRLKQLRIDKYFVGLAGWEGNEIPQDEYTQKIHQKFETGKYNSRINRMWSLPKEELKPNPFAYLRIIYELGISHKTTYVIGDSIGKDLEPAIKIGAIGIWAKYGTEFRRENFETLLKITNWSEEKIKNTYEARTKEPHFVVNSFSEIRKIVKPQQLKLDFDDENIIERRNCILKSNQ